MTFNEQDSMSTSTVAVSPTILCVDDEPNILSALRRLLRPHGYRVLTADSGAAGLALLENEAVDLVISDMRMPRMDGAQFLGQVCRRWPGTMRLLLTGYADIPSILDAINQGEIYRYLTKPWDESDIVLVVRHALERRALEQDKLRLEALTASQNLQLKALNASLEEKVAQRTRQLKLSHDEVLAANDKLKATFVTTIKVFSNLIEMRGGKLAGHARRVAELSRKLALALGLEAQEARDVFIAALLKDIGKLSLSDELLELPASAWTGEQLAAFRKHPLRAEQLLMALDELRDLATKTPDTAFRDEINAYVDALDKAQGEQSKIARLTLIMLVVDQGRTATIIDDGPSPFGSMSRAPVAQAVPQTYANNDRDDAGASGNKRVSKFQEISRGFASMVPGIVAAENQAALHARPLLAACGKPDVSPDPSL